MGFIRDRLAARHQQSSCQPCGDSQQQYTQSACSPQPLIYNTPYATRGGCQPCQPRAVETCRMPNVTFTDSSSQPNEPPDPNIGRRTTPREPESRDGKVPPLPRLRNSDSPPLTLTTDDLYKYDGGSNRRGDSRKDPTKADDLYRYDGGSGRPGADRTDSTRKERALQDEVDRLKKELEQMRRDVERLKQPSQPQYRPPQVVQPGYPAQPGQPGYPGQPAQPGRIQPGQQLPRPWEPGHPAPVPAPVVRPGVAPKPVEVKPPVVVQPPVAVPGQPKPEVAKPVQPIQPVAPIAPVPQPVKPEVAKPVVPGQSTVKPQDMGRAKDDFVDKLAAENGRLREAQRDKKIEDVKAPFERYMQGERERLQRSMDGIWKDHPETSGTNTGWLLSQPAESLIRDIGYAKKIDDCEWRFRSSAVVADEDAVVQERKDQWKQVRDNASNPQDLNWEKKQGVLQEIMVGGHIADGRRFGRMNGERGDNPLSNNKLQWQVEAAEALVKANSANVNHDYSTRAIIRGLVGNSNARGEVYLPVPEAARIKLLDAITPMSKETGNAFLGANPKDTAMATVITALERSHASRRPEEAFQTAAINKLMEFNDPRGIAVLQKLSTESANTNIKNLATAQLKKLRDKVAP